MDRPHHQAADCPVAHHRGHHQPDQNPSNHCTRSSIIWWKSPRPATVTAADANMTSKE
jgi:hypothetical protein